MNTDDEVSDRQMLPDRLQLSCSIKWFESSDYLNESEYYYYREQTLTVLKNKDIKKTFHYEKKVITVSVNQELRTSKKMYYAEIPDSYFKEQYPYISHPRLRLDVPYTITLEFNFIKYLKDYLHSGSSFDKEYNDKILIEDTNYIDNRIWLKWDSAFVRNLMDSVPFVVKQFCDTLIRKFIPNFQRSYETLTIKQIEFNKDYFVGKNRSAEIQHRIHEFLTSYEGIDWLNDMKAYCISSYKAEENKTSPLHIVGDLSCPTIKYFMADGLQFKIYRKTTDHIRLELTIYGNYVLKKLHKQNWDYALPKLFHIGKEFFRKSEFTEKINVAKIQSYNDMYSYVDTIFNFTDLHYPELGYIFDCLIHKTPVKDTRVINYIKSHKNLYCYFEKAFNKSHQKILLYKLDKKDILEKNTDIILENEGDKNMHETCENCLLQGNCTMLVKGRSDCYMFYPNKEHQITFFKDKSDRHQLTKKEKSILNQL